MVGRTNVGGSGGGGSSFLAYLQVATDPNAVITAVNLAGDTFSGTADNTGSLVLDITEPGTYTVTETNGGVETIVVADNGETYTLTVIAFNGEMIVDGAYVVEFEAIPKAYLNYTGVAPTASIQTYYGTGVQWDYIHIEESLGHGGIYKTVSYFDIANYNIINIGGWGSTSSNAVVEIIAIDEDDNISTLHINSSSTMSPTRIVAVGITSLDYSKKYSFGFWLHGSSSIEFNCPQLKLTVSG